MKKRTLNPVYNESFVFDLPSTVVDLHNVCIEFCVFDHDRVTKNEVSYFKKKKSSLFYSNKVNNIFLQFRFLIKV